MVNKFSVLSAQNISKIVTGIQRVTHQISVNNCRSYARKTDFGRSQYKPKLQLSLLQRIMNIIIPKVAVLSTHMYMIFYNNSITLSVIGYLCTLE